MLKTTGDSLAQSLRELPAALRVLVRVNIVKSHPSSHLLSLLWTFISTCARYPYSDEANIYLRVPSVHPDSPDFSDLYPTPTQVFVCCSWSTSGRLLIQDYHHAPCSQGFCFSSVHVTTSGLSTKIERSTGCPYTPFILSPLFPVDQSVLTGGCTPQRRVH